MSRPPTAGDAVATRPAGSTDAAVRDDIEALHGDPLMIWRTWAADIRGHGIDSGHHMAEEAPEALAASLGDFFSVR